MQLLLIFLWNQKLFLSKLPAIFSHQDLSQHFFHKYRKRMIEPKFLNNVDFLIGSECKDFSCSWYSDVSYSNCRHNYRIWFCWSNAFLGSYFQKASIWKYLGSKFDNLELLQTLFRLLFFPSCFTSQVLSLFCQIYPILFRSTCHSTSARLVDSHFMNRRIHQACRQEIENSRLKTSYTFLALFVYKWYVVVTYQPYAHICNSCKRHVVVTHR